MKKLQIIAALFLTVSTTIVTASDKAARRDKFDARTLAKEIETEKNRKRFRGTPQPNTKNTTPVSATTNLKGSARK